MRWLAGFILTGVILAQVPAPGPQGGGGGSSGSSGNSILLQGTIQGNGAGFAANLPSASAPYLCPASSGCVNTVGTVSMPVLEWPTGQSTYYAWWSFELGTSYTANSAISYIVEYFSADSTHAAILTPAWACVATSGSLSNPTFTSVTAINLTANASSNRTVSATETITPTCVPGNRLFLKFTIDTNTNAMTSAFDLVSVKLLGSLL